MQYHVEHHMFPLVPYHKLKHLHNSIKSQLPEANRGIIDAYKEMIPALITQRTDPSYYIKK
jgi:fatty acid desaturase